MKPAPISQADPEAQMQERFSLTASVLMILVLALFWVFDQVNRFRACKLFSRPDGHETAHRERRAD